MTKRIFTTIIILILITLIATAVSLSVSAFYKMTTAGHESVRPLKAASKHQASAKSENPQPLSRHGPSISRNLLNIKKRTETNSNGIDIENPKPTNLKFKLWGTIAGDDDTAYAIIEKTPEGKQNLVRVGDKIQNMTVKMILRGKVVLSKNGKDEILEIEEVGSQKTEKSSKEIKKASKAPEIEFNQNQTMKRTNVEDALNNADEILEIEGGQKSEKRDRSLEVPWTELPQDLTLKRIRVEDAFRQAME